MLTSFVCLALLTQSGDSVTLYRGARLANDPETRYWSAEDTYLLQDVPLRSTGQATLMRIGKGYRALIRFGDLERALGPNRKVTKARLVFPDASISAGGEVSLKRFLGRWHEGAGAGEVQPNPPIGSTNWDFQSYAEKGGISWARGGEKFCEAIPSSKTNALVGQSQLSFDGLENDVQDMYERWYDNNGWSIEFAGDGTVGASQSSNGQPRLEIETIPVAEKSGPDLSVIYIMRTPEYERYDNRGDAYERKLADGHESGVMTKPGSSDKQKWPADGEEVTYTAVIKNVGDAPSSGFDYQWMVRDNLEIRGSGGALSPGQTAEVRFKNKFQFQKEDSRLNPIGIKLIAKGPDASASNNFLEVQANALNFGIWVDEGFLQKFQQKTNGIGTKSFEDWIQWQFRIWNDVFFRHSRFGFAPDGCRESTRIQRITIVPNGTLKGGAHLPGDAPTLDYDGEWGFDSSFGEAEKYMDSVRKRADRALIHEMSHQIGLIDLYQMNVDPSMPDGTGGKVQLKNGGNVVTRGSIDLYGGLMGGGDTRNDLLIPNGVCLPQEEIDNQLFVNSLFQPTDLYAAIDVAALNANLGYRRGYYGEFMYDLPTVSILRLSDRNGEEISSGKLSFYQMKNGVIQDGPPDFVLDIQSGNAFLPNRPTGMAEPFTTLTGHTLKPNPFGRIDVVGSNGVFMVKLECAGGTEFAWLKAWQLVDAYNRGNKSGYVHELRFNVTARPVKPGNLALKKFVIDKVNSPSSNTANLVDGKPATNYSLSAGMDDWVEIDLGRDRPIGEVRLFVAGALNQMCQKFDIWIYGTGQRVADAQLFAKELDWGYSIRQKSDISPEDHSMRSLAYRAMPLTGRFIRIVNKSGTPGKIGDIVIRETEFAR